MGLGLRAAAKELQISHVALLKALKAGRVKKQADGTFDVATCRQALEQNSNPGKQKSARAQQPPQVKPAAPREQPADATIAAATPEVDENTYNEACRQLEWERVEKARIDNARKRGELAPVAEVNAWIAGMITRARDILLRIDCDDRVRREHERALRELSEFVG